jgi:hypothetical protein
MNLDFRMLSHDDKVKALDNLYRVENGDSDYLVYLLTNEKYDVYSWFSFSKAKEGSEYWINLSNKINKENEN